MLKKENNMNDKEFLDKIRGLVEMIKHYESTYNELPTKKLKIYRKEIIVKYRTELNDLLFGNIQENNMTIKIKFYNSWNTYKSKKNAIKDLFVAMANCEGSEQERYTYAYLSVVNGETIIDTDKGE